jgi:hypothetical protein
LLLDLELLDFNCYVFLQSDLNFFKHQVNRMHILLIIHYLHSLSIGIAIPPTVPTVA